MAGMILGTIGGCVLGFHYFAVWTSCRRVDRTTGEPYDYAANPDNLNLSEQVALSCYSPASFIVPAVLLILLCSGCSCFGMRMSADDMSSKVREAPAPADEPALPVAQGVIQDAPSGLPQATAVLMPQAHASPSDPPPKPAAASEWAVEDVDGVTPPPTGKPPPPPVPDGWYKLASAKVGGALFVSVSGAPGGLRGGGVFLSNEDKEAKEGKGKYAGKWRWKLIGELGPDGEWWYRLQQGESKNKGGALCCAAEDMNGTGDKIVYYADKDSDRRGDPALWRARRWRLVADSRRPGAYLVCSATFRAGGGVLFTSSAGGDKFPVGCSPDDKDGGDGKWRFVLTPSERSYD